MKVIRSILLIALLFWSVPLHQVSAAIVPTDLVRSFEVDTIYYVSPMDGKRYSFPSVGIFHTWYTSFERVKFVSAHELAAIPFGGVVYVRPGSTMVKITTDPKTYAITAGGKLRHVANEAVAASIYGADWNTHIIDMDQAFFANYDEGTLIDDANDYVPAYELHMNGEIYQTVDRYGEGTSPEPHVTSGSLPQTIGQISGFLSETTMRSPSSHDRMLLAVNDDVFARCDMSTCRGIAGPFPSTGPQRVDSYACDAFGTCKRETIGSVNVQSTDDPFDLAYSFSATTGTAVATLRVNVSGGTPSLIRIDRQEGQRTACINTDSCEVQSPPLSGGPYQYQAVVCDPAYRCSFSKMLSISASG